MPSHLEAALAYAATRGWPVFPLRIKGKQPLLPQGFHKATTDEKQINEWWNRWPLANIGIPCGEKTFCVIDVDPKSGGNDSLEALIQKHGPIPETLTQITGSGGVHYCFQPDERIGNSASRIGQGIDTRGNDRGYIVVAPSMHELGKQYAWHDQDAPIVEVPEWVFEYMRPREPKSPPPPPQPRRQALPIDVNVEERARAYLRECEPAVQGSGGHSRLLWACTAMVHGYELDNETAFQLLADEYNPRCDPPWNLANPSELREFRRKISQGHHEKQKARGWLLTELYTTDEIFMEHARAQAEAIIRAAQPPDLIPIETVSPIENQEKEAISRLPLHVLQPPGLVGDITSLINKTSRKPQPLLALATSYAFCGALFGRKVRDEWDLRTNIYCLGVAESGAGKDHSRQVIKTICADAGIQADILGGEEVTSDAAIASRLDTNQSLLFLWDEIGHMLASITDKASSGHRRGIAPYLMCLTGSAKTVFIGKEYADGNRIDIVQPNVCIYGTTVPSVLYNGLSSAQIRDGLLGRLLVFRALDDDPEINDNNSKVCSMPKSLIERVQEWFQFQPDPPEGAADIQKIVDVHQVTIPTEPKAQEVFLALRSDVRKRRNKAIKEDSPQSPLWSRVEEHARRVALIVAAGDCMNPYSAMITREHAESACELAMYCVLHFIHDTAAHIADSETERWMKKIRQMITAAGAQGIPQRTITRRTQAISRRQRDDIIQTLLDAGYIIRVKPTGSSSYLLYSPPFGFEHVKGERNE